MCTSPDATIKEMLQMRQLSHVKLANFLSGERYGLPDVGGPPDFLIPVSAFLIEEIVGKYLVVLRPCSNGELEIDRTAEGPKITARKVNGIVYNNNIRLYGNLGTVANDAATVAISLGTAQLAEDFEDMPCGIVDEIPTPPTPPPSTPD